MLKRRFGDRADWTRVIARQFVQEYLDEEGFKGYVTLLKVLRVKEPLFIQYGAKKVCIVDDQYIWLQHFPENSKFSLTTMFDGNGKVVQWYIDICSEIGEEEGRPWWDDLYLDIVAFPTGEVIVIDENEFEDAFAKGVIGEGLYQNAKAEAAVIYEQIKADEFDLLKLAIKHKGRLIEKLAVN